MCGSPRSEYITGPSAVGSEVHIFAQSRIRCYMALLGRIHRAEGLFLCLPTGNGVVIHLPGLFEEAEKNEKKGKFSLNGLKTSEAEKIGVMANQRCGGIWG